MRNSTITIRLSQDQRAALKRRAAALKKSESDLIRRLIERETSEVPILERLGDLVGSLDSSTASGPPDEWTKHLRQRNWRPCK